MPLTAIDAPPPFVRPDLDEPAQQSTPATFVGLPPTLRTLLEGATAVLSPGLPSGSSAATSSNGSGASTWQARGTLYVTNDAVSFLDPSSNQGFSVDFPTISLHAVSRTLPDTLKALAEASGSTACLYCQLDDNAGEDENEDGDAPYGSGGDPDAMQGTEEEGADENDAGEGGEDGGNSLRELWLLPRQPDELEPLFEMLSYCASLHPSLGDEDDAGGNPFAGLGAFGTGSSGMLGVGGPVLDLSALSAQGAFDDAMEDVPTAPNGAGPTGEAGSDPDGLSDTGRAVLARLEHSIIWPGQAGQDSPCTMLAQEQEATKAKAKPSRVSNTLILTSLPESLFEQPELLSSLLDLLHAYGPLQSWTPLPSMGRALVVFEDGIDTRTAPPGTETLPTLTRGQESAKRAKAALDKLIWGFEEEGGEAGGVEGEDDEEEMEWPPKKAEGKAARNGSSMRVYFGPPSYVLASDAEDALAVPSTDKNFLISPPGSPPVGWEPIREDPPNRDTLAWDLIKALGELRDQGGAVDSWAAAPLQGVEGVVSDDGTAPQLEKSAGRKGHARKGSLGPPSLVIPPSEAKVSRRQAASQGSTQPRPTPFMDRVAEAQTAQGTIRADFAQSAPSATTSTQNMDNPSNEDESVVISVPGVTVQAFEDDWDADEERQRARRQPRTGMSISSVKATVESMMHGTSPASSAVPVPVISSSSEDAEATERLAALSLDPVAGSLGVGLGAGLREGGGKRITPTGRPPLA
ncbi:hypothetical protein OC834_005110 [Tilletia horrida]|nr:hypothetical protein OC834_005110 [Tilletia horrida]